MYIMGQHTHSDAVFAAGADPTITEKDMLE